MAWFAGGGKQLTAEDLQRCNFSAGALREEGFGATALRLCSFDAFELREAGFDALSLRVAGFGPKDLFEGGFSAKQVSDAGFSASRLQSAGFEAIELKEELHLDCTALKLAGYKASEVRKVGYLPGDLKTAGYGPGDMLSCCTPAELVRAGFTKNELKPIGAHLHDGQWQLYNSYWSCCYSTDSTGQYCLATKNEWRSQSGKAVGGSSERTET